jgi:actin-related protein
VDTFAVAFEDRK